MSQRLSEAAVRGVSNPVLSPEQRKLLTKGDIEGLLEFHNSVFGSLVMENEGEDEDDDESDESDDAEGGDEDDEEGDDEDEEDESKSKKLNSKDRRIQELSAEAKKYRLKNRQHRTRIAELEAHLADKGKKSKKAESEEDDDSGSEADQEVTRQLEEARRQNEDLLIRVEFMANTKYSWKNPKAALRLLDLSDVEIDEDGEVEGLDEAIEKLATSEPYLLDTSKEEKDDKDKKRRGATGQPTGGKRKGNPNRDKLLAKYPALRR